MFHEGEKGEDGKIVHQFNDNGQLTIFKVFGYSFFTNNLDNSAGKLTYLDDNNEEKEFRSFKIEKFMDENRTISFKPNETTSMLDIFFSKIYLIETPDLLNKASFIKNAVFLMAQNSLNFFLPLYATDLILRLSQNIPQKNKNNLFENIQKVIGGEVFYDSQKDDFYFKKEGLENPVNMHATASGIRMFGFLQILMANGSLSKDSVLILDEPEVHLHPKWQLKYAEIIVELVKAGVYVLVNSHSPYMIEALKVYSDKAGIQKQTNFYLAEKNGDGITATIKDSTDDLEPIFAKLAEPLDRIEILKIEDFKW